jgi:hypothetical protein
MREETSMQMQHLNTDHFKKAVVTGAILKRMWGIWTELYTILRNHKIDADINSSKEQWSI